MDPYAQLSGYLRTGNDAYITQRHDARAKIKGMDTARIRQYLDRAGQRVPVPARSARNQEGTMKIITISREFGSGGRELGHRLAELLGVPCYDQALIDLAAARQGIDPSQVERIPRQEIPICYALTAGRPAGSCSPTASGAAERSATCASTPPGGRSVAWPQPWRAMRSTGSPRRSPPPRTLREDWRAGLGRCGRSPGSAAKERGKQSRALSPSPAGGPISPDSVRDAGPLPGREKHIGNAEQPGGGVSASGRVFRPIQPAGWAASAVSSYRARYPPSMGITMPLT